MTPESQRAAADLLYRHWLDGTRLAALPEAARPRSRAEGYAIQALLEERTDSPLFGWKIAATSAAGQAHIAVDGPLAGRILQERLVEVGGTCPFGQNGMKVAELEFAFRMARTLVPGPGYQLDDVLEAVASLHLAIEIPDSRYDDFTHVGASQLIADNACAHYFVVGPPTPDVWRGLDLATHEVTGFVGDGPPQKGVGGNALGDPRIALTWLVNELSRHGIPLAAGETVSTGTCVVPMAIAPGDHIRGDFGALGTIEAQMGA
jgi:2-keto-4-pentenoate hydratase